MTLKKAWNNALVGQMIYLNETTSRIRFEKDSPHTERERRISGTQNYGITVHDAISNNWEIER